MCVQVRPPKIQLLPSRLETTVYRHVEEAKEVEESPHRESPAQK